MIANRAVMKPQQIVASYLVAQALGTLVWWMVLWSVPESIKWFQPAAWPAETLLVFWLPDFIMIIVGSLVTAFAVQVGRPWAGTAMWMLVGAAWYATLYCLAASWMTDEAWLASAAMVAMAGLTLAMATVYGLPGQQPAAFRVTPMSGGRATAWSLVQLVIFWSVFLYVLPKAIVELEQRRLGLAGFVHPGQLWCGALLFVAASLVGFSSCLVLAGRGEGTPLPTATAVKLVIAGPYRYVRNPMALAGILQGVAAGWILGSVSVIVYAFLGGVTWHVIVRPHEEIDLRERFGEAYTRYQRSVGLWLPWTFRER